MSDSDDAREDPVESFVIRLWQEEAGQWRGRVSHVQSTAQRGFTQLGQATEFVEQRLRSAAPSTTPETLTARSFGVLNPLTWRLPRLVRFVVAAACVLVLSLGAVLLIRPNTNVPLVGTASAEGRGLADAIIFLAGAVVGSAVARLWRGRR